MLWCVAVACYFPHINELVLFSLTFLLATLGVRYHTERTVPSESKPTHFGFGVVLITFVMTVTYAAVLCNTVVTRTIQPLVIAGGCCYAIALIVAGKLMCIPEHHRQTINLITLVCTVAVSSYSTHIWRCKWYDCVWWSNTCRRAYRVHDRTQASLILPDNQRPTSGVAVQGYLDEVCN